MITQDGIKIGHCTLSHSGHPLGAHHISEASAWWLLREFCPIGLTLSQTLRATQGLRDETIGRGTKASQEIAGWLIQKALP